MLRALDHLPANMDDKHPPVLTFPISGPHPPFSLVFVEVRLRSSSAFGGAGASITAAKRRRLERAARHYLGYIGGEPPCRFDAILLDALDSKRIEWLVDV